MKSPQCDIIIPAHNGAKSLKACLQALKECQNLASSRVIVVNDSSDPYTSKWLSGLNDIVLLENRQHLGLFRSINRGLYLSDAPYVLSLHPDTLVASEGWLDRMIRCAGRQASTGMVMPVSNHTPDGRIRIHPGADVRLMASLVGEFGARLYPDLEELSSFCLLIKRAALNAIGAFDASLEPIGLSEKDFFYRALKAGYACKLADDVFVYHGGMCGREQEDSAPVRTRITAYDKKWLGELESLVHSNPHKLGSLTDETELLKYQKVHQPFDVVFVSYSPTKDPVLPTLLDLIHQLVLSGVKAGLVSLEPSTIPATNDLLFEPLNISAKGLRDRLPEANLYIATHYRAAAPLFEAAHQRDAKVLYLLTDDWGRDPQENPRLAEATYGLIPNHLYTSEWIERRLGGFAGWKARVPLGIHRDQFYPGVKAWPDDLHLNIAVAMRSGPDGGAYEALSVINKLLTDGPSYQGLLFHFLGDRVVGPQEVRTRQFQCHHLPCPRVAASVLRKSDIFVDPTPSLVGRSMALEAMASGCACIMARNGRPEFSLKEFESAILFEQGDPQDLYQKLKILLDDSRLRVRLQKSAPNLPGCYDIYKSAAEMLALIKDIDEIPSLPSLDSPQYLKTKLAILDEEMEAFSSREHRLVFLEEQLEKARKTFQSYLGEYVLQKAQIERLEAKLGENL